MSRPRDPGEPDAIDLLLPWHAVERLSPEDASQVEAALAREPARARHLAAVREERAETVALNQDLGAPLARGARRAVRPDRDRGTEGVPSRAVRRRGCRFVGAKRGRTGTWRRVPARGGRTQRDRGTGAAARQLARCLARQLARRSARRSGAEHPGMVGCRGCGDHRASGGPACRGLPRAGAGRLRDGVRPGIDPRARRPHRARRLRPRGHGGPDRRPVAGHPRRDRRWPPRRRPLSAAVDRDGRRGGRRTGRSAEGRDGRDPASDPGKPRPGAVSRPGLRIARSRFHGQGTASRPARVETRRLGAGPARSKRQADCGRAIRLDPNVPSIGARNSIRLRTEYCPASADDCLNAKRPAAGRFLESNPMVASAPLKRKFPADQVDRAGRDCIFRIFDIIDDRLRLQFRRSGWAHHAVRGNLPGHVAYVLP